MLKKSPINHNALPCLSSLPWRIWNCSSSQNTAMRSACVLWLVKLRIECLRNSLEISQQSNGRIATSPFFNKLVHHLSFERKWESTHVSPPCTAMRKQTVFKVFYEEASGFVVGKRWQQCQQAEPEPSKPVLQGMGHIWHCPGTCGTPRAANSHLPSFPLAQHCKDTWKLTLVLYPWICTLHLCMQLSWSTVTSVFWCSWCAYRIHFPCVCPIWSPCGHWPGRGQPWDVGRTSRCQQSQCWGGSGLHRTSCLWFVLLLCHVVPLMCLCPASWDAFLVILLLMSTCSSHAKCSKNIISYAKQQHPVCKACLRWDFCWHSLSSS